MKIKQNDETEREREVKKKNKGTERQRITSKGDKRNLKKKAIEVEK